ncbi:DUF1648 domain-containing protein [Muricauda sp. SCSIO 64092]|uniref:DUF1648 domain-containing protein n=1 Tax=Allomuricauda sp. SCSIO 64092 TaxID=2908842 RepID=UPI001FF61971|nr:DUF1648 domain-containing protein [Muricauda sp. SCSIO 64092]UOY07319.1 DUF1648 domain-containing protein [Muricauda sp. SCSIO 64092]
MSNQPKIEPSLTTTDKMIGLLGWIALVGIWMLTLFHYSALPEIIPIHYNAAGEADEFGNKSHMLTLPIIATVLFMGLTFLNKFPHKFNYPTKTTTETALHQYTNATRLIRILKLDPSGIWTYRL